MDKRAWNNGSVEKCLRGMLMASVLSVAMFVTAGVSAADLPSIVKSNGGETLGPQFKLDCVTRPGKPQNHADRFKVAMNMHDHSQHGGHDEHAHHRAMMENKSYKVNHASYQLPDVKLISHKGEQLQLADILNNDKPVMLNFIFTTCTTICPVLSASFHQVQQILGDEVDTVSMVSITIDPDYDTPEQLMKYSKRFKAGEQWNFYTGSYNDVVTVEKAFDIFRGSKMNHEPITLIRDQGGQHWTRINGLASAEDIVKEYKKIVSAAN
ncbi:MAG: SCO family protein [Candidatus Thiodiazotropha lotti]|nr:SCO family protein [Candidatus Thiodiazotropha endoloripes]MCG7900431.1 SCO family protein [Candidatus Thiodiazotropha weberae]MCG7990557.1 SCO family protein [Candidatus Thiodiazotropha lotti]MCG7901571.1 SCO family protein [Candidatus Thiodiazotropha weberae]MCG8001597.1 SCO family protein [Candidatus Thiodiazotropha lotti]MCW4182211.1 SCO family protein [Candidatus Thiodiazotropha weberae]